MMIGQTIKGFVVTGRLGQGAMGEVWAAEQQIVKTRVAIKLLLARWSSDKAQVRRFLNEARAVAQIKHAGIGKIYDVGFHNGSAFLIMELLEGETLSARIARVGALPIGHVGELGKQIASVLKATHAARIIHRDLKPENVFLVHDDEPPSGERAKVLDFGIAKLGSVVGLTGHGPMGTPGYMAPELWTDAANASTSADVYAFGCIAFEMCCGRRPFDVETYQQAYYKHTNEPPPRVRTFAPDVPAELDEIIDRALAKQPADRPSMHELHRVFSAVAAAHPVLATMFEPAPPPPPERAVELDAMFADTSKANAAAPAVQPPAPVSRPPALRRIARIAAVACVALVVMAAIAYKLAPHSPGGASAAAAPSDGGPTALNPWVHIAVPAGSVALGIRSDTAPASVRGFRPARKIVSPATPYEIQEHEVTWAEVEPWLAASGQVLAIPAWASDPSARRRLPVTGATWSIARAYCESLGGALPTEEQWEYAARGAERRASSWGADLLDRNLTHAYAGPGAVPAAVETSPQDRTGEPALHDLIGNVQEWTLGLWRADVPPDPDDPESWVTPGKDTSIRAIRGLPLDEEPPAALQDEPAAYREELCATGKCVEKTLAKLRYVGFRCARPARR